MEEPAQEPIGGDEIETPTNSILSDSQYITDREIKQELADFLSPF